MLPLQARRTNGGVGAAICRRQPLRRAWRSFPGTFTELIHDLAVTWINEQFGFVAILVECKERGA
ncbi:MAG: hypothetical protein LBP90_06180, partial [Burkholderiales bacterium]|nr:hypothetical protein [Burkholderiales bacterium]